ncbi:MAG TPA: twin transmembrane helix small protein [Casimicrobiaceae bacterium]|nr:twin transmembrane helix small protein [Casimicrobiaceae bacterium]
MKIVVIIGLVAVVVALFTALVFLYRDRGKGHRVVIALAVRVGLSITVVAFLLLSYWMGWIAPGGLR